MTQPAVVFEEISKFYGEVLGVNRVTLNIPPGITSLVGPNGSGKTTLMNLMTGLIFPDHGRILMRGISPRDPEALMRMTGYATQYDTAPRWATGFTFITTGLLLFGYGRSEAEERAWKALERLSLTDAANRKVAAYSKGMRQRVRLAQAIAHDPELLVLDVRDFGEKTANRNFRRLLGAAVREEDADLIAAARMKVSHAVRGRRFSFVDCLGFCVARRLKMRFVTGDEAFKGVPGVLFLMDVTSSRGTSAPRTSNVSSP